MATRPQDAPPQAEPIVFMAGGKALANSRDVAAFFGKRHGHVMRAVRSLLATEPGLGRSIFGLTLHADSQGKEQPTYGMDRTGFILLAMRFTGPKALKFRMAYIEAFNRMEAELREPRVSNAPIALLARRDLRDWPLEEMRAKAAVAHLFRKTYGVGGAQWIMPILGFPVPPKHLARHGAQLSLGLGG